MKITLKSFLVIGLMAVLFIVLLKWAAAKSKISGLQSLAAAA